ncbi:O-antigen ligase [Massilia sp. Se16.2.3]|uniref:O-antigen ligase family protein n=1 Tax=Massilia sp. Se16.2.3 TaxID=2709303 RepID=UPI001601BB49|nr:O-antigen ligase family protein [Massilia sp. Se16.2.3]QNB01214.1 O-antigen ligase family protein [Massilia sp. Se16.2.3]
MQAWFAPFSAPATTDGPPAGRIEGLARALLLLAVFTVPFSTALMNLFIGLSLIVFILAIVATPALASPLRSPPALLALALLGMILLGCTWTIAPQDDLFNAVRKYTKLLVLPIALCLCWRAPRLSTRALRWSLAGCAVLATSVYLTALHAMPTSSLGWWRVGDASDPFVFRNHITIGILLSFAACASFLAATYPIERRLRLAAIARASISPLPILIGNGRTGYVGLFVGMFAVYLLRGRVTLLGSALVTAAMSSLFVGVYLLSPNFQTRTNELVREVTQRVEASPNGVRMSYMRVGALAVAERPLFGHGTGSFATLYQPEALRIWHGIRMSAVCATSRTANPCC